MNSLNLISPLLAIDGYGYSAENLVFALDKIGIDVILNPHDWKIKDYSKPEIEKFMNKGYKSEIGLIYHLPPTLAQYRKYFKYLITMTMFETDKVPQIWIKYLNKYTDYVLVPSFWCRDIFIKSGLKKPIKVAQLGIDLENYEYFDRPEHSNYRFLITGKMDIRKNYQLAIDAFAEEFEDDENVVLVIKTRKGSPIDYPHSDSKKVIVLEKDYTAQEMRQLYETSDCYVYPSKGEGFGLPPREAMATGLPVILTNWGSLSEIADPLYSYPLDKIGLEPANYPNRSMIGLQNEDLGNWAIPDKEELKQKMRYVYENKKEGKIKGWLASEKMKIKANAEVGALVIKELIMDLK